MRTETVTSVQNPKIKKLLALQEKSRLRRETGLFVVEGRREIEHCIAAGYVIDTLFVCPEIIGTAADACGVSKERGGSVLEAAYARTGSAPGACATERIAAFRTTAEPTAAEPIAAEPAVAAPTIIEIPAELYAKVAYREGTEGMIAEVRERVLSLEDLKVSENPLIVVLEGVEKPGNLGAVLRSADAAGADAVLICDSPTDLYNPNLIRASIGAVFTVPVVCCTTRDAIRWLKKKGIHIYTAQLQDSSWYYDTDMRCGSAIAIGTEATGLTDAWREAADAHIRIPMLGRLDSLNASVSAAILLFEAVRQRNN